MLQKKMRFPCAETKILVPLISAAILDITIPYSELDRIEAVHEDGTKTAIIAGGRFVLPGTEKLNEPLDSLNN